VAGNPGPGHNLRRRGSPGPSWGSGPGRSPAQGGSRGSRRNPGRERNRSQEGWPRSQGTAQSGSPGLPLSRCPSRGHVRGPERQLAQVSWPAAWHSPGRVGSLAGAAVSRRPGDLGYPPGLAPALSLAGLAPAVPAHAVQAPTGDRDAAWAAARSTAARKLRWRLPASPNRPAQGARWRRECRLCR
jgi:hypothetical protein